eukprot:SAG11_NODE_69_length_18453_cov_37.601613_13_plen_297_part_00
MDQEQIQTALHPLLASIVSSIEDERVEAIQRCAVASRRLRWRFSHTTGAVCRAVDRALALQSRVQATVATVETQTSVHPESVDASVGSVSEWLPSVAVPMPAQSTVGAASAVTLAQLATGTPKPSIQENGAAVAHDKMLFDDGVAQLGIAEASTLVKTAGIDQVHQYADKLSATKGVFAGAKARAVAKMTELDEKHQFTHRTVKATATATVVEVDDKYSLSDRATAANAAATAKNNDAFLAEDDGEARTTSAGTTDDIVEVVMRRVDVVAHMKSLVRLLPPYASLCLAVPSTTQPW